MRAEHFPRRSNCACPPCGTVTACCGRKQFCKRNALLKGRLVKIGAKVVSHAWVFRWPRQFREISSPTFSADHSTAAAAATGDARLDERKFGIRRRPTASGLSRSESTSYDGVSTTFHSCQSLAMGAASTATRLSSGECPTNSRNAKNGKVLRRAQDRADRPVEARQRAKTPGPIRKILPNGGDLQCFLVHALLLPLCW
jgi:hypothetical protein